MLPTLVFPRLTALALVAGLGLSQTPIAQAADAPASSESGASASIIRPNLLASNGVVHIVEGVLLPA